MYILMKFTHKLQWKRLSDFEKKRFDEEADKIAQARSKTDMEEGKRLQRQFLENANKKPNVFVS